MILYYLTSSDLNYFISGILIR